jgi:LysM repeat protein
MWLKFLFSPNAGATVRAGKWAPEIMTALVAPTQPPATAAAERFWLRLPRLSPRRRVAAVAVGTTLFFPATTSRASDYVVEPGDTLSELAGRHGTTVSELVQLNGLADPHRIVAGTTLQMPVPKVTSHTVAAGESLWSIARRYGLAVDDIVAANGLLHPDLVLAGTVLVLPTSSGAVTVAPSAPVQAPVSTPGDLPAELAADPERFALMAVFDHWAGEYGVPAELLKALAWWESGWNNGVVSPAGAIGIGQILPSTAEHISTQMLGVSLDPNVAEDNIRMSARYLRWLFDHTGDTRLAIAAYYQGLAAVRAHGVFPSSEAYVSGILALTPRFT